MYLTALLPQPFYLLKIKKKKLNNIKLSRSLLKSRLKDIHLIIIDVIIAFNYI